jgi:hypothetical protein
VSTTALQRLRDDGRRRRADAAFRRRWGFDPPPRWADWVGYERLLEEMSDHGLERVPGDLMEIGALLGGGTAKLSGWASIHAPEKRVVTVDVFDPEFDPTTTQAGWSMGSLYASALRGRRQREIFDEVTAGCANLRVVVGDSTRVEIPTEQLAFAFVDGSHVAEDVRTDFETVWSRLSPGGIAAFHDYGGDLPGVTHTLHEAIGAHAQQIARVWTREPSIILLRRS